MIAYAFMADWMSIMASFHLSWLAWVSIGMLPHLVFCLILCFNHTVFTVIRVWLDLDNPLRLWPSRLEGWALPLLPIILADIWKLKDGPEKTMKDKKTKENIYTSTASSPPHLSQPLGPLHTAIHLGGNLPTSVAARKSMTTWSHSSMENSSEICMCRHLPTFQPITFPTTFHSAFCLSLHRLKGQKRCSRVWAAILPPPPHHEHFSSSRCPNHFR